MLFFVSFIDIIWLSDLFSFFFLFLYFTVIFLYSFMFFLAMFPFLIFHFIKLKILRITFSFTFIYLQTSFLCSLFLLYIISFFFFIHSSSFFISFPDTFFCLSKILFFSHLSDFCSPIISSHSFIPSLLVQPWKL